MTSIYFDDDHCSVSSEIIMMISTNIFPVQHYHLYFAKIFGDSLFAKRQDTCLLIKPMNHVYILNHNKKDSLRCECIWPLKNAAKGRIPVFDTILIVMVMGQLLHLHQFLCHQELQQRLLWLRLCCMYRQSWVLQY